MKADRIKLYVRTNSNDSQKYLSSAHPFTGYFLQNPQHKQWRAAGHSPTGEGLVSTISHDPPVLNWIYVDPSSHEVKYGTRAEVEMDEGMAGPWDVTAGIGTDRGTGMLGGGRRLTFEGWEGFVCVEEVSSVKEVQEAHDFESSTHSRASTGEYDEDEADQQEDLWLDSERSNDPSRFKLWALYFDAKDDGLSSDGRIGSAPYRYNMLEIELLRSERRRTRETAVEERVDRLRHRKQVEQKSDAKMKSLRETSIASTDSQLEVKQAD